MTELPPDAASDAPSGNASDTAADSVTPSATDSVGGTDSDSSRGIDGRLISGLRVVIEVSDWDAAVAFYRDALGLPGQQGYSNEESSQLVLEAGRATIELVHPVLPTVDAKGPAHDLQTGNGDGTNDGASPRLRLSFESGNAVATVDALVAAGAERVVDPLIVPSDSVNARLAGPEGVPITVF